MSARAKKRAGKKERKRALREYQFVGSKEQEQEVEVEVEYVADIPEEDELYEEYKEVFQWFVRQEVLEEQEMEKEDEDEEVLDPEVDRTSQFEQMSNKQKKKLLRMNHLTTKKPEKRIVWKNQLGRTFLKEL